MATCSFFYTGVSVAFGYAGDGLWGWTASLKFFGDAFCAGDATGAAVSAVFAEGTLWACCTVRDVGGGYVAALDAAVRAVMADAARWGVVYVPVMDDVPFPVLHTDGPGWSNLVTSPSSLPLVSGARGWDMAAPITEDAARSMVETFRQAAAGAGARA